MATGETCVMGARHEAEIRALESEAKRLHDVDQEQWTAINTIRNRLPTWATLVIGILMGLIGMLAAWAR